MKLRGILALAVTLSALISISCSSGPKPPQPGTPAFYWAAAQETYAAGDYLKTAQHLESIIKSDNEYTARAYPWYLTLTAGLARGYSELADNFEYGAKANVGNPSPFRRSMNDYRTIANRLYLQFGEAFMKFQAANKDATVPLAFSYPKGSIFPPSQLEKIAHGQVLQPAILEDVQRSHLQTAVLMSTTRVVGAPEDTAKTQEILKAESPSVPREVFMAEMANVMYDAARLYGPDKLANDKRVEFFATRAMDTLKDVPESKETKDLRAKIQKLLKK
jgi:hypothetical protein